MTKICVTGAETSESELMARIGNIFSYSDDMLCEVRMDYLSLGENEALAFLEEIPKAWKSRIVLTQRLALTGEAGRGNCRWQLNDWQSWWYKAMALGRWYAVDIDWVLLDRIEGESVSWDAKAFSDQNIVFSHHGEISEFELIQDSFFRYVEKYGVGLKVALQANSMEDLLDVVELQKRVRSYVPSVLIPMGGVGRAFRLSSRVGDWTYVAASSSLGTAPGQVSIDLLKHSLDLDRTSIYGLLSSDELNTYGEIRWNKFFSSNRISSIYLNFPFPVESNLEKKQDKNWEQSTHSGLYLSGVKGVSVTKPFKLSFPQLSKSTFGKAKALNTIRLGKSLKSSRATNTDGTAVTKLILERFVGKRPKRVLIVGGGGAAKGVEGHLKSNRIRTFLWKRKTSGDLALLSHKDFDVVVVTWPSEHSKKLTAALERNQSRLTELRLFVDASIDPNFGSSDFYSWAMSRRIAFVSGMEWWRRQAFEQAKFWGFSSFCKQAKERAIDTIPDSKSEFIRRLFVAALQNKPSKLQFRHYSKDVEQMINALRGFGVRVEAGDKSLTVVPLKSIEDQKRKIHIVGSATVFRFLVCLIHVKQLGKTSLDADEQLRSRMERDSWFQSLFPGPDWPRSLKVLGEPVVDLDIPTLPTSQFISGYAVMLADSNSDLSMMTVPATNPSQGYFDLTLDILAENGMVLASKAVQDEESGEDRLRYMFKSKNRFPKKNVVSPDVSSLAYIELASRFLGFGSCKKIVLTSFGKSVRFQPDWKIFSILDKMETSQKLELNLSSCPDLVPTVISASALLGRKVIIHGVAHLRNKESDRLEAMKHVCKAINMPISFDEDCLVCDGRTMTGPNYRKSGVQINAYEDHRISMVALLLKMKWPWIDSNDADCIVKSYPLFIDGLTSIQEAGP